MHHFLWRLMLFWLLHSVPSCFVCCGPHLVCVFVDATHFCWWRKLNGMKYTCWLGNLNGMKYKWNKATRSPEISREQVQRLTPQFLLYIYIGYRFPLSISTIWGNHVPVNFMLKFPTCISTIWRNHLPHLTSKWRGTFQYFQSPDKIPYIYYLEKPPPI